MAKVRHYLYPVWVRLLHTINSLTFLTLLGSGISIHYASTEGGFISFKSAVAIHNAAALILMFNYGLYVIGNLVSGNGKYYKGLKEDIGMNLVKQAKYYVFGMFKGEPHPFTINMERKFNPLQKVFYVLVMYGAIPLIIISGIGLLFPETIIMQVLGVSGLILTDYLHLIMAFFLSIFLLVHLYTCTLGEKPNALFKSMVNGYHEEEEHEDQN